VAVTMLTLAASERAHPVSAGARSTRLARLSEDPNMLVSRSHLSEPWNGARAGLAWRFDTRQEVSSARSTS